MIEVMIRSGEKERREECINALMDALCALMINRIIPREFQDLRVILQPYRRYLRPSFRGYFELKNLEKGREIISHLKDRIMAFSRLPVPKMRILNAKDDIFRINLWTEQESQACIVEEEVLKQYIIGRWRACKFFNVEPEDFNLVSYTEDGDFLFEFENKRFWFRRGQVVWIMKEVLGDG